MYINLTHFKTALWMSYSVGLCTLHFHLSFQSGKMLRPTELSRVALADFPDTCHLIILTPDYENEA